jgi:RNA 3'-terminal phosphate cyclase (ATP)
VDLRDPISLDGSLGEGGGQVLRTALSLSAVTGRPFRVERVRHARMKPGLRPQHVAAARATAQICSATLSGDEVGSSEILFEPQDVVTPRPVRVDIGTAGSAPLLFQTLCWPLALSGGECTLTLLGGTHQDHSPSFHYLALVWAPAVARLGFPFDLSLQRAGFYPEGGGEISALIRPARAMPPLDLVHRGNLVEAEVLGLAGGVEFSVAERLAERGERRMRDRGVVCPARAIPMPSGRSRGSHVLVLARFDRAVTGHGATGESGRDPERTADAAVAAFGRFLDTRAAVDPHLGDQLLVPAALVAAGLAPRPPGLDLATRYTVSEVTSHLRTNAEVIRRFLPVEISVDGADGAEGTVVVSALA